MFDVLMLPCWGAGYPLESTEGDGWGEHPVRYRISPILDLLWWIRR